MCCELLDVFDRMDARTVHAVIIAGAGSPFCAGFDLNLGADSFDQLPLSTCLTSSSTIASSRGAVIGSLACRDIVACDLRNDV
jgi:enoyl-CoA hydratase/carnithine racemase